MSFFGHSYKTMGYKENEPLSASQRAALDKVKAGGHLTGVTSVYWHLISVMGHVDAPTKKHVSEYMRKVPDVQVSRMAKAVDGKQNSGGPIIPSATALSYVAADTLFVPAAYHDDKRVYKAAIKSMCVLSRSIFTCIPALLETKTGR